VHAMDIFENSSVFQKLFRHLSLTNCDVIEHVDFHVCLLKVFIANRIFLKTFSRCYW